MCKQAMFPHPAIPKKKGQEVAPNIVCVYNEEDVSHDIPCPVYIQLVNTLSRLYCSNV